MSPRAVISLCWLRLVNQTLFGAAYNSLTQICQCEFEKLHDAVSDKLDNNPKQRELDLFIENNSLLDKFFASSNNLLYQMTVKSAK